MVIRLVLSKIHIVADQACQFFSQIGACLRIVSVIGKVDLALVVVKINDRRAGVIGEFFQQGMDTINCLLLPGRSCVPGFVYLELF
jgi:hypothetical protein